MADAPLDFERFDITSTSNRWIRLARSLHRRRQRYRERAILIEGVHPLGEALESSVALTCVLLSSDVRPGDEPATLARDVAERGIPVYRVEASAFDLAADTETPPGILAIAPIPERSIEVPADENPLLLIIDQIRDPGNLGTLIRSAQGAGAHAVLVGPGSVDPFAPKVIRAGMGSHFQIPVAFLDWNDPPPLLDECVILAADTDAERMYDEVDWRGGVAIVVGNEAAGLSEGARKVASGTVGIPLAEGLESLNAAIAGSVILFEVSRHRRKG